MATIQRPEYKASECFMKLSQFELTAHFYHLNTNSFEEHKALDYIKDGITGSKDQIMEVLLGYVPKETRCTCTCNINYQGKSSTLALVKEVWDFANEYEIKFSEKGWGDLEQLMQSLKEVASKTKYLLTLN